MRTLLAPLIVCAMAPLAAVEEGPLYADIRAQAGLTGTTGQHASLGLIAGDLSQGERGAWAGFVLGARLCAATEREAEADTGEEFIFSTIGGQGLGGFGFTLGRDDLLEILGVFGLGVCGDSTNPNAVKVAGNYRQIGGEVGWYHTFDKHYQIGLTVGWSRFEVEIDTGSSAESASGDGVDATLSLGWRL